LPNKNSQGNSIKNNKLMRIVHMTSVHRWDDNRIFNKMCRSIVNSGNEAHLIAGMEDRYDGKVIDGVTLHGVESVSSRIKRILKTTPEVLSKALAIKADLYHFHDPEILFYINRFRHLANKPVIYDVHEDYPSAILSKEWLFRPARSVISRLFDKIEKGKTLKIDGVVVAWPKILERFPGHAQIILINNYPYANELENKHGESKEKKAGRFIYVGALSKQRGILEMIKAVSLAGKEFQLILGGPWASDQFQRECMSDPGWDQCEYLGYVKRDEMSAQFSIAQAGLVLFHPEPNHLYSVPNKIFEYMSAGLPVIASDLPMQRSIVEKTGCGLISDGASPESICQNMRWIREHPQEAISMGHRGKWNVQTRYNWENEMQRLIQFYKKVIARQDEGKNL
jgi:glycosyltransferase involved in cell wall biosynthesis